ncbi:hypothetical protein GCM10007916_26850 [Psychromonas marina]|uniref:diguanylate cyclase n=1 Tax=Psychromonas marina TaxID=88364 RepID=A0ABQ6E2H1_9GAMM|nr:diguanylate cyclase [Psychromonas marina]GLS91616.1 hypothetical protein GCM10007916_26850 [Psychromonas marina]
MAQTNQTKNQLTDYDTPNSEAVVNISKYQSAEQEVTPVNSAFEQVMSQMNIADRHAFDLQYEKYWQEASKKGLLLSVLICEIDFFKAYNDNYGQQGSSFMLLVIGLALKNTCEKHDCFLARYGGNEFAILMKAGDVEKAQEVGEALRLAVEQSQTEHKYSQVSKVVTLSIGISSVYPTSMKSLMMKSEKALFSAKTSGCNRVCSDSKHKISSSENAPVIEPKETLAPKEPEKSEFELLLSGMNIITRREFNAHFCNVWKETLDDSDSLSMIICELDFFADYREHHGDQTSDDILLIVGSTLQNKCAEFNGSVSYLEGNKFVALIKGGNVSLGLKTATEFQSSIENLAITNTFSPVKYCLTMSLGLANVFPSDTQSMKGLMNSADSALKLAQSSGYDQVQRV